jgi:hypothetical protein
MSSSELTKIGETLGLLTINGGAVIAGYQMALDSAKEADTVLVAGSHYLVGELLANEKSSVRVV